LSAWFWVAAGVAGLWLLVVGGLALAGRRTDARALAGFVPDCVVLVRRLARDGRVDRRWRWALGGLAVYLLSPIDLVPDVIPGLGYLDDALLLALVLRGVVRAAGAEVVHEHWPGPPPGLAAVLRLAGA
jgi:uncharacterized membrane protein YkvA (DUF1232 family)